MYTKFLKKAAIPTMGMMFMYNAANASLSQSASVPRFQPVLSSYRPSDYLHMYYAVQAYENSEEKLNGGLKEGWALSSTHKVKNGYFGVAFLNRDQKHIIISHRGTEDLKDLIVDLDSITRHLNIQEPSAWNDFAKKVIEQHGPEYSYSFTGHSLGGWLAQVCLWKYQDEFVNKNLGYKEAFAVTMDEPGAKEILEALQPRGSDYKIDVNNLDITNYLSYPNIVNTIMGHVGTVYGIFPEQQLKGLSWLQRNTLSFSLTIHSSKALLEGYFSEGSGLPTKCTRVLDWPRVLWGAKLPSSNQSKGALGYMWHMFKSYAKGDIERGEYTGFYTYNQNEVNNPQTLSSEQQFQLQHGIHYRVESFNPQILPLRNMPRAVRRFLEDLSHITDRGNLLNKLAIKEVNTQLLDLIDSYEINTDTQEIIITNNRTVVSARAFRDEIIGFLTSNEELYKHKLVTLQTSLILKMIEELKTSTPTDIFAQLQNQTQYTQQLLDKLSFKQGTARLYKFIKPSLDEIEQLREELQAINSQMTTLEISKLKLEDSQLQSRIKQQLIEKLNTQEQQLNIAKRISTALLMYMQNKLPEANKELESLISALNSQTNLPDLDHNLLQNRAYNLKAKIATVNGDRALAVKYYNMATTILADDAITWSNLAGLLTDAARAEAKPSLHIDAYRCYQIVYPKLAQFKIEQEVIAKSGMAYGLIMLAQNIEQGFIDANEVRVPGINDLRLQAKSLLNSAIRINPNYINARLFSALLAYEEKDYSQALQEINNTLTLQPIHPTALMRKGFILEKMGKTEEALNYLMLAKERLEATQKGNENTNWIREMDDRIAEINSGNRKFSPRI